MRLRLGWLVLINSMKACFALIILTASAFSQGTDLQVRVVNRDCAVGVSKMLLPDVSGGAPTCDYDGKLWIKTGATPAINVCLGGIWRGVALQ